MTCPLSRRSEWRMATQNYAQFENEDEQSRDDTSITIDLDEPSSSFRETSPQIISTDNTQNVSGLKWVSLFHN